MSQCLWILTQLKFSVLMCIEGYDIVIMKVQIVSFLHASPRINSGKIRIFVFEPKTTPHDLRLPSAQPYVIS
jgi:hypothetical protein